MNPETFNLKPDRILLSFLIGHVDQNKSCISIKKKVLTSTKAAAKGARKEIGDPPFTFRDMVEDIALATAKADLASRPDLGPYRGMKSSESGAPDAISFFGELGP